MFYHCPLKNFSNLFCSLLFFPAARLIASPPIPSSSSSSSQSKRFLSAVVSPASLPVLPPIPFQSPGDTKSNQDHIEKKEEPSKINTPPTVPMRNVVGLLGRHAMLPCNTTPPSSDNPLLLVIWFKEPSPDPVYRQVLFKSHLNNVSSYSRINERLLRSLFHSIRILKIYEGTPFRSHLFISCLQRIIPHP